VKTGDLVACLLTFMREAFPPLGVRD
jgi:hypothetical protein